MPIVDHEAIELTSAEDVSSMITTDSTVSLACQTELTMREIDCMESDNCLMRAEKRQSGGYPQRDQLAGDSKLLSFYTGFNCFHGHFCKGCGSF